MYILGRFASRSVNVDLAENRPKRIDVAIADNRKLVALKNGLVVKRTSIQRDVL